MTEFTAFLERALRDPQTRVALHVAEEREKALDLVQQISWSHTGTGADPEILHTEAAIGCAWCVSEERAHTLDQVLDTIRPLDPEDYEIPSMRSARVLAAYLDLEAQQAGDPA